MLVAPLGYSNETFENLQANRECPIMIPSEKQHPNELDEKNKKIRQFLYKMFAQKIRENTRE